MTDLVQNPQSYIGKAANDVYAIIMHFIPGITSWASKRRDNLNALVEKTKKKLERKGFSAVSERPNQMKTGVLLIESASLEEDDFLQERWATLLSNTLSPDKDIDRYPQFVSILKELSSLDARLLNALSVPVTIPKDIQLPPGMTRDDEGRIHNEDGSFMTQGHTFARRLSFKFSNGVLGFGFPSVVKRGTNWDLLLDLFKVTESELQISINLLERLGVLSTVAESNAAGVGDENNPAGISPLLIRGLIELTPLGLAFVAACNDEIGETVENTTPR